MQYWLKTGWKYVSILFSLFFIDLWQNIEERNICGLNHITDEIGDEFYIYLNCVCYCMQIIQCYFLIIHITWKYNNTSMIWPTGYYSILGSRLLKISQVLYKHCYFTNYTTRRKIWKNEQCYSILYYVNSGCTFINYLFT